MIKNFNYFTGITTSCYRLRILCGYTTENVRAAHLIPKIEGSRVHLVRKQSVHRHRDMTDFIVASEQYGQRK